MIISGLESSILSDQIPQENQKEKKMKKSKVRGSSRVRQNYIIDTVELGKFFRVQINEKR